MNSWKALALSMAKAFDRMVELEEEARNEAWVAKAALKSELNESRAETEDARARCKELEQELELAREARDILLKESKEWRDNPGGQTVGMANLQAAALRAGR